MKRTLLLTVSAVAFQMGAFAQSPGFYIERNDLGYAGQSYQMSMDSAFTLPVNFNVSDTNLRWDLSTLAADYNFVTRLLAPDANNGGDQVDECNLVFQEDDNIEEYGYANESEFNILMLNTNMDSFGLEGNLGRMRAVVFPLMYDTSWTDSSGGTGTYPGSDFGAPFDSVRLTVTLTVNSFCDGSGWLILPVDSVFALRVRQEINVDYTVEGYIDFVGWSQFMDGSENSQAFSFYSNECGFRLATVVPDTDDPSVAEVSYRSQTLVSNKPISILPQIGVYPNPATEQLNVTLPAAGTVQVFDLNGRAMGEAIAVGEGQNSINTAALAPGAYFIRVILENGEVNTVKFIRE